MALPPNAKLMSQEMDPADVADYVANGNPPAADLENDEVPLLDSGEVISSYTLTMSPEGAALGVTISQGTGSEPGAAPSLLSIVSGAEAVGATAVKFWLYVTGGFLTDPAFDGTGTFVGITLTVNTNSVPSRRRQRTLVVKVAQQ